MSQSTGQSRPGKTSSKGMIKTEMSSQVEMVVLVVLLVTVVWVSVPLPRGVGTWLLGTIVVVPLAPMGTATTPFAGCAAGEGAICREAALV